MAKRNKPSSLHALTTAEPQPKNNIGQKAGRRPTLTEEIIEAICAHIRRGNFFETSVQLCGISAWTARDWFRRGLASSKGLHTHHDPLAEKFYAAVREAEAFAESQDVDFITQAARSGNWQAAAWRLERKHPRRWGRKARIDAHVQHTGPSGGPVEVVMTREEREKRITELEEKRRALRSQS